MSASGSRRVCDGSRSALEAIELEAGERVDRRDLVDDEHLPADADDAAELGDDELRARDVMERADAGREIERPVLEGQVRDVGFHERHVGEVLGGDLPARVEHLGHDVRRDDLPHERCGREREPARAGAGIQHPLLAGRLEEALDLRPQLLAAALLVLGHERRRRGEPRLRRLSVLVVGQAPAPPPSS